MRALLVILVVVGCVAAAHAEEREPIRVGSKKFTESVILGDVLTQMIQGTGRAAEHLREVGGSSILFNALLRGELDVYPEYTGTLMGELLAKDDISTMEELRAALARRGIRMSAPLGFENTYALGMTRARATELGIQTISDLRGHPALRMGFTNEFVERADGWPAVRKHYGLPQQDVRGLDHSIAYRSLTAGDLDVIDFYTTDAEIALYGLVSLEDDRSYWPSYQAVILFREDLAERDPEAVAALERLVGRISAERMQALNASALVDKRPEILVAADFVEKTFGVDVTVHVLTFWERLWLRTREHALLVGVSLTIAIVLGFLLGVLAARMPLLAPIILGSVGLIWVVPSLALFYFMTPLVGLGALPTILALILYSVLTVARTTFVGLRDIPVPLRESAEALGLPPRVRFRKVELPLALPSMMAGIKMAAVINVGTATIGAIIAAGGYGQPILTGIRRDEPLTVLEGTVPAVVMAVLVLLLLDVVERALVSPGLRLRGKR